MRETIHLCVVYLIIKAKSFDSVMSDILPHDLMDHCQQLQTGIRTNAVNSFITTKVNTYVNWVRKVYNWHLTIVEDMI